MHFVGWAYNLLVDRGDVALIVAVFVLLPLSIFKSKRRFAGAALKFCGFVFLLNLWAYALAIIWKAPQQRKSYDQKHSCNWRIKSNNYRRYSDHDAAVPQVFFSRHAERVSLARFTRHLSSDEPMRMAKN